jgi:hypothetical protein
MTTDNLRKALDEVTESFNLIPYDINCGDCYEWAERVFEELKDTHQIEIWEVPYGMGDTCHAFLKINGKFYDAEALDGVDDYSNLPIFNKLPVQPVWVIDANFDDVIENRRCNITHVMLVEYDEQNGTNNATRKTDKIGRQDSAW